MLKPLMGTPHNCGVLAYHATPREIGEREAASMDFGLVFIFKTLIFPPSCILSPVSCILYLWQTLGGNYKLNAYRI